MKQQVILITGGSSGIGYETANPLSMDVTDETSMQTAVSALLSEQGHIDVLINNAGYGSLGITCLSSPLKPYPMPYVWRLNHTALMLSLSKPSAIKTDWGLIAADHLYDSSQGTVYETFATKEATLMRKLYISNLLSYPPAGGIASTDG